MLHHRRYPPFGRAPRTPTLPQPPARRQRQKGCPQQGLPLPVATFLTSPAPVRSDDVWGCYFGFTEDIAWREANTFHAVEQPPFCRRPPICRRLASSLLWKHGGEGAGAQSAPSGAGGEGTAHDAPSLRQDAPRTLRGAEDGQASTGERKRPSGAQGSGQALPARREGNATLM